MLSRVQYESTELERVWEDSSIISMLLHSLGLSRMQKHFWLQMEWEGPPQQGKWQ